MPKKSKKPVVKYVGSTEFKVFVEFEDGRVAEFEALISLGSCEGLETLKIHDGAGNLLFHLNVQSGPENGVVPVEGGLSQKEAARYWASAREYLDQEYFRKPETKSNEHLQWPWRLVCCEETYAFNRLKEGKMKELSE